MKDLATLIADRERLAKNTELLNKKKDADPKKKMTPEEFAEKKRIMDRIKMFREKEAKDKR